MLRLGQEMGRQRAHDLIYKAAQATATEGVPFLEQLMADPEISSRLTTAEIIALLDPATHAGLSETFAAREAQHARRVAAGLRERSPHVDALPTHSTAPDEISHGSDGDESE